VRKGRVFKRCSRCGGKVPDRRCVKCGSDSYSYAYIVDVASEGEVRKQRRGAGFKTMGQARDAMNRLQAEVKEGTHVEPSRTKLGTYLAQWLEGRTKIRANTRRDYRVSITKHIAPRLGEVPLQGLTRVRVKALYQQLAQAGLAQKTVHNIHICLRKALNDAVEDGLIRRNPAERIDTKPKDRPEMVTWSADELASFLSSAAQDQEYALYHVAAATGMRRGELLGLRWRDLDLDAGRVNVRQQYQGRVLGFCPPKSRKGVRTIEVDEDTMKVLREHREAQGFLRGRFGDGYATELDLVFCRADGTAHDLKAVDDRFGRRVRQLRGLPTVTLHGLRHTHATLLLEEGVDVKTVSERLGHDSVQTTLELYGHVTPRMRANAASRFGVLLGRAREPRAVETATIQ